MFRGCVALTYLDLSKFDTSNVTDMTFMFEGCKTLTSLDLSNFDTSNVMDMTYMFGYCESLTNLNVSHFNTSNVAKMGGMFSDCHALPTLDVSHFNTSNVTNMASMFRYCVALTTLDVSKFVTSKVTNMWGMFEACGVTTLNLSHFNTNNVTEMGSMFSLCNALTTLDVSHFNTSNVTNMSNMFEYCSALTNLDVSNFDTSKVTDMGAMFNECCSLNKLDLNNFDTSNVTDMRSMFRNCNTLTCLDISNFDTSNVWYISNMFEGCIALTKLDLKQFDTSYVTEMNDMLLGCSSLELLSIGNKFTKLPNFTDCKKIKKIVSYQEEPCGFSSGFFTKNIYENTKLFVPKSTKTLYTITEGWKEFKNVIEKDISLENDGSKNFGMSDMYENTNLDGNILGNMFFNIPKEDGGYDIKDKCIVLTRAMTDEQIENIMGLDLFDIYLLDKFRGMVFMVNAGKGKIAFEAKSVGNMQLSVKIGNDEPISLQFSNRSKMSISYNVVAPTFIFVYSIQPSAKNAHGMQKTNTIDNALKIYGIEWNNATSINDIQIPTVKQTKTYGINGQQIQTPKKGIYIVNGKKMILK